MDPSVSPPPGDNGGVVSDGGFDGCRQPPSVRAERRLGEPYRGLVRQPFPHSVEQGWDSAATRREVLLGVLLGLVSSILLTALLLIILVT